MELPFNVNGQIIRKQASPCLANDSQNYLSLGFTFDETWQDYNKYVIFTYKGKHYQTILEYDSTAEAYVQIVPVNVLKGKGFYFTIYGTKDDERITTHQVKVDLLESGYTEDISSIDYPEVPDIFTQVTEALDGKVDKEQGKALFSGSYTDLSNKPTIPSKTSDLTNDGDGTNVFVKNNDSRLSDARTPTSHTHTKSQITDFPTIPSSSSDLSDGSNIVKKSNTTGLIKNDGSIMTSGTGSTNYSAGNHTHSEYVSGTKVTSWSSTVSDSNVPSEKLTKDALDGKLPNTGSDITLIDPDYYDHLLVCDYDDNWKIKRVANISTYKIHDPNTHINIGTSANANQMTINSNIDSALGNKQASLESGVNIKTINNESILGSGNISVGGGSTVDIVTSWEQTPVDTKVASEKLTKDTLDDKISKSQTAGLVKNDGTIDTTTYSTFSGSYTDLTDKPSIPASSSDLSDGSSIVKTSNTSGLIKNDGTIDTTSYSTFSGSYTDLSNKPSIPASSSDLSDGTSLVKTSNTTGLLKNDGSVMTSGTGSTNYSAGNHTHSGYVSATKVTSWSSTVSDSNVPSEKLVKDYIDNQIGTAIQYIQQ